MKENGVHGGIRTHGPRIHTTSTFAAARSGVRGLDCPFTLGRLARRCCPTSLYTFPFQGLARDRQGASRTVAFPEFEQIRCAVSKHNAQFVTRNPVLYPAELRRRIFLLRFSYTALGGSATSDRIGLRACVTGQAGLAAGREVEVGR